MTINPENLKLSNVQPISISEVQGKTIASITAQWQGKRIVMSVTYGGVVKKTNDEFLKDIQAQQQNLLVLATKYKLGEKTQQITIDQKQIIREFTSDYIVKRMQKQKPASANGCIISRTDKAVVYQLERLKQIFEKAGLKKEHSSEPPPSPVVSHSAPQTTASQSMPPTEKFEKTLGNIKIVLKEGDLDDEDVDLVVAFDEEFEVISATDNGTGAGLDIPKYPCFFLTSKEHENLDVYARDNYVQENDDTPEIALKNMYIRFLNGMKSNGFKIINFQPLYFANKNLELKAEAKAAWDALKEFQQQNSEANFEVRFLFESLDDASGYNNEFR